MLDIFFAGLLQIFTWPTFPLMLLGTAMGFAVGILPGLGGVVALALMLPFTFGMEPVAAFAFLLGMLAVTATTGDITSILFGVPGESISAATIIDGHPMAKNGEAGRALGAALMSSLIGAVCGAFLLAAAVPVVQPLVMSFASPEFFALSLLGITFIAAASGGSVLKGLIAGGIGLMLSMVGLDSLSGIERYTFDQLELWDGISIVAITTGIFGLPEIVELWQRGSSISTASVGRVGKVRQGIVDTFRYWGVVLRCSAIGTFVGLIPGLGASIGQWLAYAHAVQSSPDRERFSKGDVRGVLGPGAANNSAVGGGLITTIGFGVPGNAVFAILLGAFQIQGLVAGPQMLTEHLDLVFSLVWIIVVTNIITVIVCLLFIDQLVKITLIRGGMIIPSILILIFLGGYVESRTWFAVFLTLAAGGVGYAMMRLDWPRPPLILGLVLGTLTEKNLFTSYQAYGLELLSRPVVAGVLLICLVVILWPLFRRTNVSDPFLTNEAGSRSAADLIAGGIVFSVVAWAVWAASAWPIETRLFPWVIGFATLLLVLLHCGLTARRLVFPEMLRVTPSVVPGRSESSPRGLLANVRSLEQQALLIEAESEEQRPPDAAHHRRGLTIVLWCIAFALSIALTGFKIGGILCTFLFLRFAARESWVTTIIAAAATYIFFFLVSDVLKLTDLGTGLIFTWLASNP